MFAGATGTALLIIALAMLCGAGSLLAFRAQRREAAALRARTEFLTMVTHELKTPLAGVRLVGELLADGHVTDAGERAAWLARLNAEAARLGLIIEKVLDLGRLERGERAHAPAPLELNALVAETAALFAPLAERDGLTLRLAPCAAPAWVAADAGALRQALLNLLDNARKYGRGAIDVAVAAEDGTVAVAVRDHGDGVATSEREAIFARFARGAGHRHGAIPGVGLGLHLARAIALRHGGALVCRAPDTGPGARFELTLPALLGEEGAS
jgi:signal transduction histidine kinase